MYFPGYENLLAGNNPSADPNASPCGNENCKTLKIPENSETPSTSKSIHLFHLAHGTAAHEEAMKPGGKIEKVDPASVDPLHKCELAEHDQPSLSITNVLPIHAACFAGNVEGVRAFIQEHGKEYIEDLRIDLERNVPEFAARGGQLPILKLLHEEFQIDVDPQNERGATPVAIAAQEDQKEMVKYLLDVAKADANHVTKKGRNVLSYVIGFAQDIELAKHIHDNHNSNVSVEDNDRLAAVLLDEIRRDPKKNLELFRYSVEHLGLKIPEKYEAGISPDRPGDDCMPPIITAALISDVDVSLEVLEIIVKQTPNVNVESWCGLTGLHAAGSAGNIKYLKRLIELGATVQKNRIGTPLHHSCLSLSAPIIKFMIEKLKIDPNWSVPTSEVKPIHLLVSTMRTHASEGNIASGDSTPEQKFLRCLYVMLRNGYENNHFHMPKSYLSPSTPYFPLTSENMPASILSKNKGSSSSSASAAAKSSSSASNRSKKASSAGGASSSDFVEIEESLACQNLPVSALFLLFDYGHRLDGSFPLISLYNSSCSYSNFSILRFLDELGFTGSPDDSVVAPEYGCVAVDAKLSRHATAGAGGKKKEIDEEQNTTGDNEDTTYDSSEKELQEYFAQLMAAEKKEEASTQKEDATKTDGSKELDKRTSTDAQNKFQNEIQKIASRRKKYGNIVIGSPIDPTAVATVKYVWMNRTYFGKFLGGKTTRNSSFTLDGLVGFAEKLICDSVVGFFARKGWLCNRNRWDSMLEGKIEEI